MPIEDRMTVDERRKYIELIAPRQLRPHPGTHLTPGVFSQGGLREGTSWDRRTPVRSAYSGAGLSIVKALSIFSHIAHHQPEAAP